MRHTNTMPETRLSIRLQGPLAEHVNRQVETALYKSHSEYIRDLVRRDMGLSEDHTLLSDIRHGLSDIGDGRFEKLDRKRDYARSVARVKAGESE